MLYYFPIQYTIYSLLHQTLVFTDRLLTRSNIFLINTIFLLQIIINNFFRIIPANLSILQARLWRTSDSYWPSIGNIRVINTSCGCVARSFTKKNETSWDWAQLSFRKLPLRKLPTSLLAIIIRGNLSTEIFQEQKMVLSPSWVIISVFLVYGVSEYCKVKTIDGVIYLGWKGRDFVLALVVFYFYEN